MTNQALQDQIALVTGASSGIGAAVAIASAQAGAKGGVNDARSSQGAEAVVPQIQAAVRLASDNSEYVQGTTLFVDGGMTLYPGFATGG